jgi:predicted O-methyltransferase YrrM
MNVSSSSFALAARHLLDLSRLFAKGRNNEIAYYNFLFSIAIAIRPRVILELGTGPGNSSRAFIRALQYWKSVTGSDYFRLHSCDIDPALGQRLRGFGPIVQTYTMKTDELALHWATYKTEIDLLFIDADHSHEQSLRDFLNFSPWVRPDGLVVLHDTYPLTQKHEELRYSGGVWKTAQIIKQEHCKDFEIMTVPALCGFSLLRRAGGRYF